MLNLCFIETNRNWSEKYITHTHEHWRIWIYVALNNNQFLFRWWISIVVKWSKSMCAHIKVDRVETITNGFSVIANYSFLFLCKFDCSHPIIMVPSNCHTEIDGLITKLLVLCYRSKLLRILSLSHWHNGKTNWFYF